jgi:hypothetical protein
MISGRKKWERCEKLVVEKANMCAVLVGEHEEKRPLEIPRHKW